MNPDLLAELMRQAPALGAFAALIAVALRWLERSHERCHQQHRELLERYRQHSDQVSGRLETQGRDAVKSHGRLMETLGSVSVALERCARSHEELERMMRERG
jgi:hypothetical protein